MVNPSITTLLCVILNLLRSHQADLFSSWDSWVGGCALRAPPAFGPLPILTPITLPVLVSWCYSFQNRHSPATHVQFLPVCSTVRAWMLSILRFISLKSFNTSSIFSVLRCILGSSLVRFMSRLILFNPCKKEKQK